MMKSFARPASRRFASCFRPSEILHSPPPALPTRLRLLLAAPWGRAVAGFPGGAFPAAAGIRGEDGIVSFAQLFADGSRVQSARDWPRQRAEIFSYWHGVMGAWPPLLEKPKLEVLRQERRENFSQRRVRIETGPGRLQESWLLVPEGRGPFPAVLVVYYEPETSVGLNEVEKHRFRDYGRQLARRGFVTLNLGRRAAMRGSRTLGRPWPRCRRWMPAASGSSATATAASGRSLRRRSGKSLPAWR